MFDGRGREWVGTVHVVTKQQVTVGSVTTVEPIQEATVPVTLVIGVLKGDQMDAVVRDATMLGVAAIVPLQSAHVAVPPRAWKSGAARERWQRVAVASAAQCRRAVVPEIESVTSLSDVLAREADARLLCVEPSLLGTAETDWRVASRPRSVQLLVGPEGGWAPAEVAQARQAGARLVQLGPRTLRAETAPIVALTLVSATWGW